MILYYIILNYIKLCYNIYIYYMFIWSVCPRLTSARRIQTLYLQALDQQKQHGSFLFVAGDHAWCQAAHLPLRRAARFQSSL